MFTEFWTRRDKWTLTAAVAFLVVFAVGLLSHPLRPMDPRAWRQTSPSSSMSWQEQHPELFDTNSYPTSRDITPEMIREVERRMAQ